MGEVAGPSLVGTDTAYGYDRLRAGISRGGPRCGWGSRQRLEIVRTEGALAALDCPRDTSPMPFGLPRSPRPVPPSETVSLACDPIGKPDERTEKLISKGALVSGWPHLAGG